MQPKTIKNTKSKKLMKTVANCVGPDQTLFSVSSRSTLFADACLSSLFLLRFYGPVNPMGSCRARSVYLTTNVTGQA